jgi:HEAT repeat protein
LTGWTASSDPAFTGRAEGEGEGEETAPKANVFGLILVPLMLVLVAVGIFGFINYMTYDERTLAEIQVQLRSPIKQERWIAARMLIAREATSPEIVPVLEEILAAPPEDQAVVQSFWADMKDVLKKPEEKEVNLRWFAAKAMASIHTPETIDRLIELSRDADASVRFFAVAGLGNMRATDSEEWLRLLLEKGALARLIEALEEDDDEVVRMAAALSMGYVAGNATIVLREVEAMGESAIGGHRLEKIAPTVTARADEFDRAGAALRAAFGGDASQDVRFNAAQAMALLGDETGRTTLEGLLRSGDPKVRITARRALERLDALTGK